MNVTAKLSDQDRRILSLMFIEWATNGMPTHLAAHSFIQTLNKCGLDIEAQWLTNYCRELKPGTRQAQAVGRQMKETLAQQGHLR